MIESYEPDRALWAQFDAMGEKAVTQALIDLTLSDGADWQAQLWLAYRVGPIVRVDGLCCCLRDMLTTNNPTVRALILHASYWAQHQLRSVEICVHRNFDRLATSPRADRTFVTGWTRMHVADRMRLVRRAALDALAVAHEDDRKANARALQAIYAKLTG